VLICLELGEMIWIMVPLIPLPSHHLLVHGAGLPRLSWKKTIKWIMVMYVRVIVRQSRDSF